jgi:DNA-binding beta-propeller fold protein YncE
MDESWSKILGILIGWGFLFAIPEVNVVYSQWGTRDMKFISPKGVFVDRINGEIYVADPGTHSIFIFNEMGVPIYRFTHRVKGKGKLGEPSDLVVDERGYIYVVDQQADYVDILNPRGISVDELRFDEIEEFEGKRIIPVEISIDSQGNIYVGVDGDEACVLVFDPTLKFLRKIGCRGKGRGKFQHITGLWVDGEGNIYVTDIDAFYSVQVFDKGGKFLYGFGKHQEGWENFSFPSGVVKTGDGTIWVVDALRQVVKGFNSKGEFIAYFGGKGTRPGELLFPSDISWDGNSRLVVLERVGRRFQIFELRNKGKGGMEYE